MRSHLFTLGIFLLSTGVFAQSNLHKLGITAGGGSHKYRGDLGNGFTVKNRSWYGGVNLNISYYLNKSFDGGIFGSIGDYGYCQSDEEAKREVSIDKRCTECIGRVGLGNLNSRMKSGGLLLKYKLSNGYLLAEESTIQPYLFFGSAFNSLTDRMKMNCVNAGNYFTLNGGLGARYFLSDRISLGYNFSLSYFTRDNLDNMSHGINDMLMQNSLVLGVDLF